MLPFSSVIVNHNTCDQLRNCLHTVMKQPPHTIIVVDNDSTDGSVTMVKNQFPDVTLLTCDNNRGYGAAANAAIAQCATDYVLLLNSDTRLEPGAMRALDAYLYNYPRAAIVGPRLLHPEKTLQPSCYYFPNPLSMLLEELRIGRAIAYLPLLRQRYLPTWSHHQPRVVPWVQGSALAIRRLPFLEVGGFDESYFMYYEETDLCYRLQQVGWQVHFAPVATVVHIGGASTDQYATSMLVQLYASMRIFCDKHYPSFQMFQMRLLIIILMAAKLLRDRLWQAVTSDPAVRRRLQSNTHVWKKIIKQMVRRAITLPPENAI